MHHPISCTTAGNALQRARGLIGRNIPFTPFYIPRCSSIHTCFMRIPLNLLWVDCQFRVVRIDHGVHPWKFIFCPQAAGVIEYHAGSVPQDIVVGDTIKL